MQKITRKDLLKAGAGTTAVAGLAMTGARVAQASDKEAVRVHIHVTFEDAGGPGDDIKVSVTADGSRDDLSGDGWDFETKPAGGKPPSFSACYFTQEGSVQGNTVRLKGTTLFANDPGSIDVEVTTTANRSTGRVTWTFGDFEFKGHGTVVLEND